MKQEKHIDFSGENLYISLDVHKKQWTVTTRMNGYKLELYSSNPSPKELVIHLRKKYPNANYYCVYEAGFSGFGIQRELEKEGIKTLVVNPADVPTKDKEKQQKRDKVDSQKLARELENGNLEGIYIPEETLELIRSLNRLRSQLVIDRSRVKNRIKCYLMFTGRKIPEEYDGVKWSHKLTDYLRELKYSHHAGEDTLSISLNYLEELNKSIKKAEEKLRTIVNSCSNYREIVERIDSLPGIGFVSAVTIWSEIMDIRRFRKFDQLCCFVGLIPSVRSSGDKEIILGLQKRQNKYLKNILIEASWVAIRKDPALMMSYGKLIKRMSKQKAIIKIAKKLLNRLRYVWLNNIDYQCAVIS